MKTILYLLVLTSFVFGDFKIGMPKNPVSDTFENLSNKLIEKNLLISNDIKIIKIDMQIKDIKKLRNQINNLDLFFITGSYFNLYFNTIKPNTNALIMGNKNSSGIKNFDKDKILGIYRLSAMENIKDLLTSIKKDDLTTGILTKKDSVFHKSRVKKLINLAKKQDIEMIQLPYQNRSDIEQIFKDNQGKLNSIQIWPASIKLEDVDFLVQLQFKYKIPLVVQKMSHIKKGAALGYLLEYDKTLNELVNYIQKLSSGIPINELKSQDGKHIHVVNLNSISKLNLKLTQKLIKNSKIIINKEEETKLQVKPKEGKYTIALPNFKHTLYSKYLNELKKHGYEEDKNLKIIRFNTDDKTTKLPKSTNLIFTMGNFFDTATKIRDDVPLVLYSIYDFKKEFNKQNMYHLDINEDDIVKKIKLSFPDIKNIKVIGDKKAKMPFLDKKMTKVLSKFGHKLSSHLYDDIKEVENIFKKMNPKKDMILLFPVSIKEKDIEKLVKLQNKYKIIIVSQMKKEVKKGISFAISTDIDFIAKTLATNSHNILQGIKASECIVPKVDLKFYVNLKSLRDIGFQISEKSLRRAEVIIK